MSIDRPLYPEPLWDARDFERLLTEPLLTINNHLIEMAADIKELDRKQGVQNGNVARVMADHHELAEQFKTYVSAAPERILGEIQSNRIATFQNEDQALAFGDWRDREGLRWGRRRRSDLVVRRLTHPVALVSEALGALTILTAAVLYILDHVSAFAHAHHLW